MDTQTKNNKEQFSNVEIVVHGNEEEAESETAKILHGLEKSLALDTAALLGGNEYLIKQMLDEIEQIQYNEKELGVLRWALTEVWGAEVTEKVLDIPNTTSVEKNKADGTQTTTLRNQKCLNELFTEGNRKRLPHTLSNSLLYCGRHEDTKIYTNPLDHMERFILLNLRNYPYIDFPIGNIPDISKGQSTPTFQKCEKIAVIYFKLTNEAPSPYSFGARKRSAAGMLDKEQNEAPEHRRYLAPSRPRERQLSESQKLSESLALEKGMLSRLHFIGIVPVP